MQVVGFVGPSGTGKSYRALWIAKQKDINYVIDDGLLISNNKVIAGISSKKEPTKIAATRRACFFDKKHVTEVKNAIDEHKPESILIVATSNKMANVIRNALNLDEFSEIVHINDIATSKERNKALEVRTKEGKHVIPVPTFELKRTFSGHFMDGLKIFKKKGNENFVAEKTVMRPPFSYLGMYTISEKVIKDITTHVISELFNVNKVSSIEVSNYEGNISITLNIILDYNELDRKLFPKIQGAIKEKVESLTCMNVLNVNIVLKSLRV